MKTFAFQSRTTLSRAVGSNKKDTLGLFSIFNKNVKVDNESTILWEDDYRMIEIVSKENLEHVLKEIKRGSEFGQIQEKIRETKDLSIELSDLVNTIELVGMKRIPKVFYDGKLTDSTKTVVYVENKNGLYIEQEDGIIEAIWLAFYNRSLLPNSVFENGLKSIGNNFEMIMVDWNRDEVIDLTDEIRIKEYLVN